MMTRSALAKRVDAAIADQLAPGERIEAALPYASSGMPPWLVFFGSVGVLLGFDWMKFYGVVVTDRRVFLVRFRRTLKPSVEENRPRASVRVGSYQQGVVFGKLVLQWPGGADLVDRPLALDVQRYDRSNAEGVAAALGGPVLTTML